MLNLGLFASISGQISPQNLEVSSWGFGSTWLEVHVLILKLICHAISDRTFPANAGDCWGEKGKNKNEERSRKGDWD